MSLHSDPLSRFQANPSLLFLNDVFLTEKQHMASLLYLASPHRDWKQQSTTLSRQFNFVISIKIRSQKKNKPKSATQLKH
jgi:hypothetical protein